MIVEFEPHVHLQNDVGAKAFLAEERYRLGSKLVLTSCACD